jgi:hypothetical protein
MFNPLIEFVKPGLFGTTGKERPEDVLDHCATGGVSPCRTATGRIKSGLLGFAGFSSDLRPALTGDEAVGLIGPAPDMAGASVVGLRRPAGLAATDGLDGFAVNGPDAGDVRLSYFETMSLIEPLRT